MKNVKKNSLFTAVAAALVLASSGVSAAQIQVKITNNAGATGSYLTPAWVGFHNGSFDIFNVGEQASAGLEALAEDGDTSGLSSSFSGSGVDGTIAGLIAPGATVTSVFTLSDDGSNNYFSYASMLLPSSDFFIGNSNPFAFNIASLLDGTISSLSFDVSSAFDAGTEVNDFATSAGNGLFGITGGQGGPNQGADQNGVVSEINGLAFASFLNANGFDTGRFDFTNSSIVTIELTNVSAVPVPAAAFLFAPALLGFMGLRRKAKIASAT